MATTMASVYWKMRSPRPALLSLPAGHIPYMPLGDDVVRSTNSKHGRTAVPPYRRQHQHQWASMGLRYVLQVNRWPSLALTLHGEEAGALRVHSLVGEVAGRQPWRPGLMRRRWEGEAGPLILDMGRGCMPVNAVSGCMPSLTGCMPSLPSVPLPPPSLPCTCPSPSLPPSLPST